MAVAEPPHRNRWIHGCRKNIVLAALLPVTAFAQASTANERPQANWELSNKFTTQALQRVTYSTTLQPRWLATADQVVAAIGVPGTRILDSRTVAEMDGSDTRLSSRGGIIPSAASLYWEDLLDPVAKTFRSADELRALFQKHGLTSEDEVIAYCWVGHRSAVDLFALRLVGYERVRNYLGSWEEWSRRMDLPTAPFKQ